MRVSRIEGVHGQMRGRGRHIARERPGPAQGIRLGRSSARKQFS